jgi:hypothetical protein
MWTSDPLTSGLNESTTLPFYRHLKQSLADPKFLPEGGTVAFALTHEYPALIRDRKNFKKAFHSHLKGADALFYSIAVVLGLKIEMRTVYKIGDDDDVLGCIVENIFYDHEEWGKMFMYDEFSPLSKGRDDRDEGLVTSKVATDFEGGDETDPIDQQILENCKAFLELPVMWAFKDGKNTKTGAYASFGNS